MLKKQILISAALAGVFGYGSAFAACSTTIGNVMSLTGSLGQQISKGAQLTVADPIYILHVITAYIACITCRI